MARLIITLTTDYGTGDHLVGAMKGVILNIKPDAEIEEDSSGAKQMVVLIPVLT